MLTKNPFIEPCSPTLAKEPPVGRLWVYEVKFDGYRVQIHKDGKHVTLYSRNANEFTERFKSIASAVAQLPIKAVIFDAEITSCREDGSPDFPSLLHRQDTNLCLWVFDILSQNGTDLRALSLSKRRMKLNKLMSRVNDPAIKKSEIFFDPTRLLHACAERSMEGIVAKRTDMPYRSGPSKDWLKTKCAKWREENSWRREFFQ